MLLVAIICSSAVASYYITIRLCQLGSVKHRGWRLQHDIMRVDSWHKIFFVVMLAVHISFATYSSCKLKKSLRKISAGCVAEAECAEECVAGAREECEVVTERVCGTVHREQCSTRHEETCTTAAEEECGEEQLCHTQYTQQCRWPRYFIRH